MGKEKEEIGKLLELLNEYQNKYIPDYPIRASEETINSGREILISKRYGFIKWLVENDKIDFELDSIIHKHKGIDFNTGKGIAVEKLCDRYESLLMLLAIQDEPIRFLCEILK